MAVSNLITLTEYAKGMDFNDVRRPIIETFAQYSDVLQELPFEGLKGAVYLGFREQVLPTPAFRAINEASSSGHGIISPFQEATYRIDHDIDVDMAIVDRHGPERRNYETKLGITAFARLWVDTFIKGDQSTNPRVFNGLQVRANTFGRLYHNSTSAGGGALSLTNLDVTLNQTRKDGSRTFIFAPYQSIPLWIQAARNTTLAGFVIQTWDEIGEPKMSYAGHKFLWGYPRDFQVPVLQFNEVGTGGGAAQTASLYTLTFGEGMMRGLQLVPLSPEDVGLLQDRIHYRTHIRWDVGLVTEHPFCMARLDSWTYSAIGA